LLGRGPVAHVPQGEAEQPAGVGRLGVARGGVPQVIGGFGGAALPQQFDRGLHAREEVMGRGGQGMGLTETLDPAPPSW
jgi:hypothetical protein